MGVLILVGGTTKTGGHTVPVGGPLPPLRKASGPGDRTSSGPDDRTSSGVGELVVRSDRVRASLDSAWSRAEKPVAASDYAQTAEVQIAQVAIPVGASDAVRTGLEAVAAREQEAAALNAYATSYGRFLGAVAAGDRAAALRQATTMSRLVDGAATVARSGAQLQAASNQLLAAGLTQALAGTAPSTGGSANSGSPSVAAQIPPVLTPEMRAELATAGAPPQDIATMQTTLSAMTPDSIRAAISLLNPPAPTTSPTSAGARTPGSGPAAVPQPPDLARLEQAQHIAHSWVAASTGAPNPDLISSAAGTAAAASTVASMAPPPPASTSPAPVSAPAAAVSPAHPINWPHPRPWWALPASAVGAVVGYGRWLRIRRVRGTA